MSGMTVLLLKVVGAGLLCAAMLNLSGKGAQREILRLGCMCVMTVLLAGLFRGRTWQLPQLELEKEELARQIEQVFDDRQALILEETEMRLAEQIEEQASQLSISCTAQVSCTVRDGTVVVVEQVRIAYTGGSRERLPQLQEAVAQMLGIEKAWIVIQEG